MSSTNKTTHYNLSQYIASDKPTYLVDYNADMSAIDSGIYAAKSEADTNATSIGTLSSLTTTAQTDLVSAINEVDGDLSTLSGTVGDHTTAIATNTSAIGTLANLDTTNKSNLVSAINEVEGNIEKFNLTTTYTLNSPTSVQNCTYLDGSLTLMTNADKSIFKLYGGLRLHLTSQAGSQVKATFTAPLNPSADYTISPFCLIYNENGTVQSMGYANINSDGTITIGAYLAGFNGDNPWFYATPCIYFNKDFGDQPTPNA